MWATNPGNRLIVLLRMSKLGKVFFTGYPDLLFWGSLLVLNLLLFLPLYLLNRDSTTFLPLPPSWTANLAETLKQLFLWRNNLDIFRLNAEILLLVALWVYLPWLRRSRWRRLFCWLFAAIYFMVLSYAVYESVTLSLYQVDPVFFSQFQLAVDGLAMVARNLQVPVSLYLAAGLVFVAGVIIVGKLIGALVGGVAVEQLSRWSKGGVALLAILVIVALITEQDTLASPKMAVSSFAYKLRQNIGDSMADYRRIQAFDDTLAQNAYSYTGQKLIRKPNIYLIFVESYGSVLYHRPDYRQAYTALLSDLQAQLQAHNWYAASALSEAPTWGGGSWMSYTSTLFGLRVDTHPQFLSLLDRYQFIPYPDLGHYLKGQGYEYVRLTSLSVELEPEEWSRAKNFYGVDRWLDYSDLNFKGPRFGWGPAPPDQYALYYAHETVLKTLDKPFFFFFITQNSHYPWIPLPEVVDDWQTLNEPAEPLDIPLPDPIPHQWKRQNYLNSINYELRFLTDYILQTGDDDSIFIIIGDHQPQQVSRRNDSFNTPVHILSRDGAFVEALLDYGFVPGLEVQEMTANLKHEGIYSMLVRVLLAQYGQGIRALPDYLPGGVTVADGPRH